VTNTSNASNVGSFLWLLLSIVVYMAYLVVMLQIVVDLFRDPHVKTFAKVLWILGLIFLPIITALIYVVARGRGMAERQKAASERARAENEASIKEVAGTSPADQITKAKTLLESGAISPEESLRLKSKALA
jgi:hypothetical protein